MPAAENLRSVQSFFEKVLNAGDMAWLEGLSHRDVIIAGSKPGVESFKRLLVEMRGVFANPEYKVMDSISDGEKVVVRFSGKATHSGRYLGINATALRLRLWGVMIFRFEAGSIAEFWSLVDAGDVLSQLREASVTRGLDRP
ncbi:MAG: ester cyclase [Thaumarchaeota archaeon]|nr:ester cyclase [Nitrososphaerota archaeon]